MTHFLLPMLYLALILMAQDVPDGSPGGKERGEPRGLVRHKEGAFEGYTLIAPLRSRNTYLLDMAGQAVHVWEGEDAPGNAVYLFDSGELLRCIKVGDNPVFHGGGEGGRIQRLAWDGTVLWDWSYTNEEHLLHHDIEPLPNGNLLVIAWERRTKEEARAAGRDPDHIGKEGLWPDKVLEIKPTGTNGAETVWEWHSWDHIIQDTSPDLVNFGDITAHPERIDINGDHRRDQPLSEEERESQEKIERQMRALGYLGDDDSDGDGDDQDGPVQPPEDRDKKSDWLHTNSIDYDPVRDLIILSARTFSELWVIDHSTTTEEAKGHTGGRQGKGGDLVYRWGNARNYGRDGEGARDFYLQHDTQWIDAGLPGEGHILAFNNGEGRPGGPFSTVDEIIPPWTKEGGFMREEDSAFGPEDPCWSYGNTTDQNIFSSFISGAQRLPNGNTLICSGVEGRLLEVTPSGKVVWEFENTFGGDIPPDSPGAGRGPRRRGPPPPGPRPGRRGPRHRPGPDGPDGPPHGGPPPGDGMGRSPGGLNPNALFRATRLSPDHPGLAGLKQD
jgi:hypothetical protein